MSEQEKQNKIELSEEEAKVLQGLNPQIIKEKNKTHLLIDVNNFKKEIENIKEKGSMIILESDLLGLRCRLDSKNKSIEELQKLGHDSMRFLLKEIPSHSIVKFPTIPRGVG